MVGNAALAHAVGWVRHWSPPLWRALSRIPAVRRAVIANPTRTGAIQYTAATIARIMSGLRAAGIDVRPYTVDVEQYRRFVAAAGYAERYPTYYASNRYEKSLEHYIAADLLRLAEADVYIDVASEGSPAPEIYRRLYGCTTYRQDLTYTPGISGQCIGSDAAAMPVPAGFADKMALHCSFEHFEVDRDIRFMHEVRRILAPRGAVCIVPLYLFDEYAIQTDPSVVDPVSQPFDPDAIVYCAMGWANRHGRFYDAAHLVERVQRPLGDVHLTVYRVTNAKEVEASCYVEFAALIARERPAT